ncbi:capsid protein [Verrucomicrobium sp. GAS474]|uniref:phage portal protein n=1 Tax=Verrucomicrobium sp. GAS474 TaxID=1882831 RepID=UPI00087B4155|nr:phage portal protein [Verrucomicrobium sp. GAS474]SDU31275.1 capsid protein [Verrucomicrobium sp. GAS474]
MAQKQQKPIRRQRLQSIGNTYYESAQITGQRSQAFLAFPQTAEKEFSYYNRRTILRKKRYLEANLSIIGALIKKVGKYSVGMGVLPMPCTGDQAWDDHTTTEFIEWASNPLVCDAMGMQDFFEMQKWNVESEFGEAEAFTAMVSSAKADSPQLQLIDPGEVEYYASSGTPPGLLNPGESSYIDGVKVNSKGRILAYAVRVTEGGGGSGTIDVDASNMIHLCDRRRPNQYRGLSAFASVANSGVDVMDLKALEVATVKLHSALAIAYTKNEGKGMGAGGFTDQLKTMLATSAAENGTQTPTGKTVLGEDIFAGAMIKSLGVGEDIKLLSSSRPTVNLISFLEWFYREIAVGTELSVELIWNLSLLGGANARINLADIQALFDMKQGKLNRRFNRRVWIWWLSKKFAQGYPMPNARRWWDCHWLGPAKINADAGNTAQSRIADLAAGFGSWAEFWASQGKSWKGQITQRISEVKFAQEECKRLGVDYAAVFPPPAGTAAVVPPDQAEILPAPQPAS